MTRSKIRTSGAEGLTLSSTDITISSGDLLFGTSAKGVNLGVTSNTDANTLDDYEEGTFTPTLLDGSSASQSITGAAGTYTKIGNMVHVFCNFTKNTSSGSDGTLKIGGLPFTSNSTPSVNVLGNIWIDEGGPSGPDEVGVAYISSGATFLEGVKPTTDAQRADTRYFQYNDLSNGRPIYMSTTYRTAS